MNEGVVEEIVVTIGAALGAMLARRLLKFVAQKYIIWDGVKALEDGLPGWAE